MMTARSAWCAPARTLRNAIAELKRLTSELAFTARGVAEYEVLNLLTLATQIAKSALLREESRGVHLREDFPDATTCAGAGTSRCACRRGSAANGQGTQRR